MCSVPHKSLMIDSFFHVFGQRPLPFAHSAINFNATDTKRCVVRKNFKRRTAAYDVRIKHKMFVTDGSVKEKKTHTHKTCVCSIKAINTGKEWHRHKYKQTYSSNIFKASPALTSFHIANGLRNESGLWGMFLFD